MEILSMFFEEKRTLPFARMAATLLILGTLAVGTVKGQSAKEIIDAIEYLDSGKASGLSELHALSILSGNASPDLQNAAMNEALDVYFDPSKKGTPEYNMAETIVTTSPGLIDQAFQNNPKKLGQVYQKLIKKDPDNYEYYKRILNIFRGPPKSTIDEYIKYARKASELAPTEKEKVICLWNLMRGIAKKFIYEGREQKYRQEAIQIGNQIMTLNKEYGLKKGVNDQIGELEMPKYDK